MDEWKNVNILVVFVLASCTNALQLIDVIF
jgi:hypothetical protein